MSLQKLINDDNLERVDIVISEVKIKKEKAFKAFYFSYKNLELAGFESEVYKNILIQLG